MTNHCDDCNAYIPEGGTLCELCVAEADRYTLADGTDRAALETRLRYHLFHMCDTDKVRGDYHKVSTALLRHAAKVFGPCQSDAEYNRVAGYCEMLASEFGGAAPF